MSDSWEYFRAWTKEIGLQHKGNELAPDGSESEVEGNELDLKESQLNLKCCQRERKELPPKVEGRGAKRKGLQFELKERGASIK